MTSAFGYTIAGISVIVDLGRWWNFANLLAPWLYNHTSVLLEVALCIMAYTLVVWIEFVPVLMERRKDLPILQWTPLKRLLEHIAKYPKRWNRTLIVVISLGVLLPIMHQSSLGSMMVIAGAKVHPLWQTPVLPLLFLFSVAFMGYSVVVMESFASSHFLYRPCECPLIQRIIPVITVIGLIWIGLRFATLFFEGKFGMLFGSGLYSIFFWTEIVLVVAGIMMMMFKRYSYRPKYIFFSAFLLVAAGALYRMNTYLIAFSPGDGYVYFPSVIETLATLGFLALEVMLYILFIRVLPVLPAHEHETKQHQ
jgi:Ni/Fe-hydrogenase subunit HybB-like protein